MSRLLKATLAVVLIAMLAAPLTVFANQLSTFQPDEFNDAILNPVWTVQAGFVAGQSATVNGTHAVITAPPGPNQTIFRDLNDPTVLHYNAPRTMQPFGSDPNAGFGLEVKFDTIPGQQFQQQGVLLEKSATDVLRIEFYSDNGGVHLYVTRVFNQGGSYVAPVLYDQKIDVTGATSLFLRVSRVLSAGKVNWTVEYKTNLSPGFTPIVWASTPPSSFPIASVGLYAGTSSNDQASGPGFTTNVDYIRNLYAPNPNVGDIKNFIPMLTNMQ